LKYYRLSKRISFKEVNGSREESVFPLSFTASIRSDERWFLWHCGSNFSRGERPDTGNRESFLADYLMKVRVSSQTDVNKLLQLQ